MKQINIQIAEKDKEQVKNAAMSVRESTSNYILKAALLRAGVIKE